MFAPGTYCRLCRPALIPNRPALMSIRWSKYIQGPHGTGKMGKKIPVRPSSNTKIVSVLCPVYPSLYKIGWVGYENRTTIYTSGCIMYSTTSGHQGISSPPSEGKKYHIWHSAVYMKSKQRVLSLFLQNGSKFKIGLLFCCYIVMTDAFRYALLAFLFAVIV